MKSKTRCLCGSTESSLWAHVKGSDLIKCLDCDVIRVAEVDPEKYEALYSSGEYHAKGSPDLRHEDAGRQPHSHRQHDREVAQKRLEALSAYKEDGMLIDVGCANAAVVIEATWAGWRSYGVDLSDEAVPEDFKQLVRVGDLGHTGFTRRSADVIMFNDSFEHFVDPLQALRYSHGILKRDGVLVIDIPDMGSPLAQETGTAFHHIKPAEHLWYFSAKTLRALLEREGFTVLGMEVPVPGKVTVYASPDCTVTDVVINGPAGAGDIIWTLNKIAGIREAEAPCRIRYNVQGGSDKKMNSRSRDLLGICSLIDSFSFEEAPNPLDNACPDLSKPEYNFFANDFVDQKKPPFEGQLIETWHPELPSSWDTGIETPVPALEQARTRLRKAGKYVAVYMSSEVYNSVTLLPGWTPMHWAEFCVGLRDRGLTPVIVGADWDLTFVHEVAACIIDMGLRPSDVWVNLVGKTSYPMAMAVMQLAEVTVGIASGLPITAAYLGWRSLILWPVHGISKVSVCRVQSHGWTPQFPYSWMPPHLRDSGSYKWLAVGTFTVESLIKETIEHARREISAAT